MKCYSCGKPGHISKECKSKSQGFGQRSKRWCENCKSSTHFTTQCRNKRQINNAAKNVTSRLANDETVDEKDFAFCAYSENSGKKVPKFSENFLVDTGATSHIISEREKFVKFEENFNPQKHMIELADGSRANGIVQGKGDACIMLQDNSGKIRKVTVKDALYVPTYKQDIFSVQAATQKGATVTFTPECAKMKAPDGTVFDIEKQGRLYYLNSVKGAKSVSRTVSEWHRILGHCNMKDILKLENVVEGMRISSRDIKDCETCSLGKMVQYRSRKPDMRAKNNLK